MLDAAKLRKEALALIKQGCAGVKEDSSKISLIQLGMVKLNQLSGDDLPDSSIKYGIAGMKYRALAKESPTRENVNQSIIWYNKAFEIETNSQWKQWWEASIKEMQRIK